MTQALLSLTLLTAACAACSSPSPTEPESGASNQDTTATVSQFTASSTVAQVASNPAFGDFGHLLFPVDRQIPANTTLEQVSTPGVFVWYSHIQATATVDVINRLHTDATQGKQVFYRFYSDSEIASDGDLANTGLFFFRGETGAPFAICNAGGGFMYVGALHDSMPHALYLSQQGMNAFAIIYRPDHPYQDLARAIAFITDHARELGVQAGGYSLWGGSAGARMAATLGNAAYLQQLTGRTDIGQAAVVVMQYTGYSSVSQYDAPTYACCGTNDGIASYRTMQSRLQALNNLGIPTEFHSYQGLPHGFGLGVGTVAEGWAADALRFWKQQIK